MKKAKETGFTLIELMIVVAIIGILAAIAIPAYQDYTAKAQASEALMLLMGKKTPLSEFYADMGRWPTDISSVADQGSAGHYIATVSITQGAGTSNPLEVSAHIRPAGVAAQLQNKNIIMTTSDGLHWSCGSADVPTRLMPQACR